MPLDAVPKWAAPESNTTIRCRMHIMYLVFRQILQNMYAASNRAAEHSFRSKEHVILTSIPVHHSHTKSMIMASRVLCPNRWVFARLVNPGYLEASTGVFVSTLGILSEDRFLLVTTIPQWSLNKVCTLSVALGKHRFAKGATGRDAGHSLEGTGKRPGPASILASIVGGSTGFKGGSEA